MQASFHLVALDFNQTSSPYIQSALTRLGYLHPSWRLKISDMTITATIPTAESPDTVLREIRYAIYREKIFAETMDMRRDLLRMVARP